MESILSAVEFGSVGVLTLLLVEFGKRTFPRLFTSDTNVWWSAVVAITVNGAYTMSVGGDVWASITQGAVIGFTLSGVYRGVAGSSKRNAVDLTEQVNMKAIAREMGDGDDEGDGTPIGFTPNGR